jgi:hypothetical protein
MSDLNDIKADTEWEVVLDRPHSPEVQPAGPVARQN